MPGTFTARTATTTFDGSVQNLTGTTSFYNFKKIVTASSTLSFGAGETTTITNDIWLTGTDGNLLVLKSTTDDTEWSFDPQGERTISYVNVQDSSNENATAINCVGQNCTNSGNNTNWTFVAPPAATTTVGGGGPSSTAVNFINGTAQIKYSTGTLVKYPNSPEVYLVNGNIIQHIPDEATFNSLGFSWSDIIEIAQTDIIAKGNPVETKKSSESTDDQESSSSSPQLIKYPDDPKVYLLKDNTKYWILHEAAFNSLGYSWQSIEIVPTTKQYRTGLPIGE